MDDVKIELLKSIIGKVIYERDYFGKRASEKEEGMKATHYAYYEGGEVALNRILKYLIKIK